MRTSVIGERKLQYMFEIIGDDTEPSTVREPVGMQGEQNAGRDAEESKHRPCPEQMRKFCERGIAIRTLRTNKGVNHASKENRFRELCDGKSDIGDREKRAQSFLRTKHREYAGIETKKGHYCGVNDNISGTLSLPAHSNEIKPARNEISEI
jgi:hypothetical protein